ncbi:hypothetical protein L7F22_031178 [Adiantum nelumboides]|nr:hypothetical protein [Adiantum nelumboides]
MEVMGTKLRPVNKEQASQVEEEVKEQPQENNEEMIEGMLSKNLTQEEKVEYKQMLQKFPNLFVKEYINVRGVDIVQHQIELKLESQPRAQKLRRLDVVKEEALLKEKVEEGLQRLNGFGGQLNPDKCHIGEDEVILLGHKISQRGIEVDPAKAKALLELPSPKSIKEVTSFMQKVKYMARFIHLASELLHPLQKLTQQVEFAWSEDLEEYFKSIKMVLSELPTLMPPCWDFPFFVNPSVGVESIGAILLQQDPQSSRMRPVYFTSRVTTNIEKGYSEAELMMLSLIFAVRKFRSHLLTKPFVILTSENLLPWVSSQMTMSPKISKWLMELQSYEYTFKVENSVRAQLARILTYRLHEKVIKVPNVRPLPPPPPKVLSNAYTLFFDGTFRRATEKAGGALVLVNLEGEVVMKEQVTLDGSTSNNEIEYDTLISGLKICLAQKIRRLMVKGDALLIVKQILGLSNPMHDVGSVHDTKAKGKAATKNPLNAMPAVTDTIKASYQRGASASASASGETLKDNNIEDPQEDGDNILVATEIVKTSLQTMASASASALRKSLKTNSTEDLQEVGVNMPAATEIVKTSLQTMASVSGSALRESLKTQTTMASASANASASASASRESVKANNIEDLQEVGDNNPLKGFLRKVKAKRKVGLEEVPEETASTGCGSSKKMEDKTESTKEKEKLALISLPDVNAAIEWCLSLEN